MQFSAGRRVLPSLVAVVFALAALPASAPPATAQSGDAAGTVSSSVARIDALGGDVAIVRGDDNATLAAAANAPILPGDYVTTGPDGHAEVGFDGRSAVRLGAGVQLRLVSVDPADRQIQLAAGTIELRLFGDTDGQSEIDTPSVSVIPRTAGSFRVAVDDNGETAVTVRAGRADVETPQGDQSLEPGTTLLAAGPAANPSIQRQSAVALDDFDAYNADRDRIYLAAAAAGQYVNTDIAGVGDLNGYGDWVDDGSYGYVWMPTNVAPGWAWYPPRPGRRAPDHPQIPAYAQPQYYRQTTPAYAQPQYNRQTAPAYALPQYTRAAAPVYARPASSAYARSAVPAYGRAPQPHF